MLKNFVKNNKDPWSRTLLSSRKVLFLFQSIWSGKLTNDRNISLNPGSVCLSQLESFDLQCRIFAFTHLIQRSVYSCARNVFYNVRSKLAIRKTINQGNDSVERRINVMLSTPNIFDSAVPSSYGTIYFSDLNPLWVYARYFFYDYSLLEKS